MESRECDTGGQTNHKISEQRMGEQEAQTGMVGGGLPRRFPEKNGIDRLLLALNHTENSIKKDLEFF